MNEFYQLNKLEQEAIISNTASKLSMPKAIIEKDYGVCWMLDYLFNHFKYNKFICFKGGTSLSKIYHCIDRFSEDIDLAIDWNLLNIDKDEAYKKRSNRQQEFFNNNANKKTEKYLSDVCYQ